VSLLTRAEYGSALRLLAAAERPSNRRRGRCACRGWGGGAHARLVHRGEVVPLPDVAAARRGVAVEAVELAVPPALVADDPVLGWSGIDQLGAVGPRESTTRTGTGWPSTLMVCMPVAASALRGNLGPRDWPSSLGPATRAGGAGHTAPSPSSSPHAGCFGSPKRVSPETVARRGAPWETRPAWPGTACQRRKQRSDGHRCQGELCSVARRGR
jgi:hypothetical protein